MELIIATEEKIEEIVNRCLSNQNLAQIQLPKQEVQYYIK
jgi:hypothetical protein